MLAKKLGAEFLGTFLLVLGGCGSAIFAARALAPTTGKVGIGGVDIGVTTVTDLCWRNMPSASDGLSATTVVDRSDVKSSEI